MFVIDKSQRMYYYNNLAFDWFNLAIGGAKLEGELPVPMVWVLGVSFARDQRVGLTFEGAGVGGKIAGR
jgi:hypothetical protein